MPHQARCFRNPNSSSSSCKTSFDNSGELHSLSFIHSFIICTVATTSFEEDNSLIDRRRRRRCSHCCCELGSRKWLCSSEFALQCSCVCSHWCCMWIFGVVDVALVASGCCGAMEVEMVARLRLRWMLLQQQLLLGRSMLIFGDSRDW